MSDSLLQKIFSLETDNIHKIITILGFKIKFKSKKLKYRKKITEENKNICDLSTKLNNLDIKLDKLNKNNEIKIKETENILCEYFDFIQHHVPENTILMVEPNNCHCEVISGIARYFLDLGFNIEVLIRKDEAALNPFHNINDYRFRYFAMEQDLIQQIVNSIFVSEKYKYLYINSDIIYNKKCSSLGFFDNLKMPKSQILQMCHHLDLVNTDLNSEIKFLKLTNIPTVADPYCTIVNAHRFREINNIKTKNNITHFITVGKIESQRKNFNLLIDTVRNIVNNGYKNFKITIISKKGNLDLPTELESYFNFKSKLPYSEMFDEIENADFFLTLLDPENQEHDRYITSGTSGSFQLVYGLCTPCLIEKKFADVHRFDEQNSIIYSGNQNFVNAMIKAIDMNKDTYSEMCSHLKNTAYDFAIESENNLSKIINYQKEEELLYR